MKQRLLTALVLIPAVLLVCFWSNPLAFLFLCLLIATIGVDELKRMFRLKVVLPVVTLLCLSLPFFSIHVLKYRYGPEFIEIAAVLFLVALAILGFAGKRRRASQSEIDMGGLWVAAPLLALTTLHDYGPDHTWRWKTPLLLVLLPLWGGDTAAYFVGKYIGRHPLWPSISPKKTVEGAVANLIISVGVGVGVGVLLGFSVLQGVLCGVSAGVLGQLGDLFESYLKRRMDVKDSGNLLPGHGGLLDRIDSMLFTAIPVAAVVYFIQK